jgi:peptidoglycan/LPS O-acetylase OafA/YrhL
MTFKNFLELEKKTSSGLYLENLTGIRALAVLWVLILHTWAITGGGNVSFNIPFTNHEIGVARVIRMGEWGVDIFFVLSGFLLTTPFLRARKSTPFIEGTLDFYRRRAFRLIPAYYFTKLVLI